MKTVDFIATPTMGKLTVKSELPEKIRKNNNQLLTCNEH